MSCNLFGFGITCNRARYIHFVVVLLMQSIQIDLRTGRRTFMRIPFNSLAVLFLPSFVLATTWSILPGGAGDAPTIQAGIDSATAGDTVSVEPGIFYEHDIALKSGVVLAGSSGDPDSVVIDAQQLGRVLRGNGLDSMTVVEGLTLTHGLAITSPDTTGGGIFIRGVSPLIRNCIIQSNEAIRGGGAIYRNSVNPKFIGCIFENNTATQLGGGLYGYYSGGTIDGCIFRESSSPYGGGFFGGTCTATFTSSDFIGNQVSGRGGACIWGAAFCLARFSASVFLIQILPVFLAEPSIPTTIVLGTRFL